MPTPIRRPSALFLDTLNISNDEHQATLERLQDQAGPHKIPRRAQQRLLYPVQFAISIEHPGGTVGGYLVRCRDLSAGGTAFLHGNYLHVGTRCVAMLPAKDGRWFRIPGKIVRCRHLKRKMHEVGVQFTRPLDVSQLTGAAARMAADELPAAMNLTDLPSHER